MITKTRTEDLKQRIERRRQPSRWGNNPPRILAVQPKYSSPISDLTLQDANDLFRGNYDARKINYRYEKKLGTQKKGRGTRISEEMVGSFRKDAS
jgi:hypothetical protein